LQESTATGEEIEAFVRKEKGTVIRSSSQGLIEPIDSTIKFGEIGGLDGAKQYFLEVRDALGEVAKKPQMINIIPKGVLMAGPPGTGKTLLAKALATESGVSIVKMGDVRSQWVGESERQLTKVLDLLKAMAPVIVFIDEIDQAIGQRSTNSGDSGVNARMFGKILEFMGDNANRGDVIWIAATNRADILDDAMLRRFDRIIPVLLPGSEAEWVSVVEGIGFQLRGGVQMMGVKEFVKQNINLLRMNHSGSSMEMVVRRAYEDTLRKGGTAISQKSLQDAFEQFKTNFNLSMYKAQTLLSVFACNEVKFIPKPGDAYSYGDDELDKVIAKAIEQKSNSPLEPSIQQLRGKLNLGLS
jgi:transitional endoplasmic reticulum ATPase